MPSRTRCVGHEGRGAGEQCKAEEGAHFRRAGRFEMRFFALRASQAGTETARRDHVLCNSVYGGANLRQMRAALMTVPSTGPPDRKRCRLSETDLSNARSLFAKQQGRKQEKNSPGAGCTIRDPGGPRPPGPLIGWTTTRDGARDPSRRPSPRGNASRSGTPSTRAPENTRVDEENTRETTYCTATPAV